MPGHLQHRSFQIVLVTREAQTRRLALAVAGEHQRENRGLGELKVAGLRLEKSRRNDKGTSSMGATYVMNWSPGLTRDWLTRQAAYLK